MSLEIRTFICCKCGKPFRKAVGGVIMTPQAMELTLNPVCDKCKLDGASRTAGTIVSLFK